jgi:ubiquinone/menaquinone biosynthesis C-methylase UbiE
MTKLHRQVYRSRMTCLGNNIIQHLSENDKILDVGCGFGEFSDFIYRNEKSPKGINIIGIEKIIRPNSLIEVKQILDNNLPFDDNYFDCVMLLDVLHHERNWDHLLDECIRVSKNIVIIKDHQITTKLSYYHVCLLDWLANKPYKIECLYKYFSAKKWREIFKLKNMEIVKEDLFLNIYPTIYQILFPGKLQYFTVLKKARLIQDNINK